MATTTNTPVVNTAPNGNFTDFEAARAAGNAQVGTPGGSGYTANLPDGTPAPVQRYTKPDGTTPGSTASDGANSSSVLEEYMSGLKTTDPTDADKQTIRDTATKNMQAYIDAVNSQYASLKQTAAIEGQDAMGRTRGGAARSGTLGSDFGDQALNTTQVANDKVMKALADEQNLRLQEAYTRIDQSVKDEVAARKAEALGNRDKYINYLDKAQTDARANITKLGETGVTAEQLKQNDPARYAKLLKDAGYSDFQLQQTLLDASNGKNKSNFVLNGDQAVLSVYNPQTGKIEVHTQTYDPGNGGLVKIGNQVMRVVQTTDENGNTVEAYVPAVPTAAMTKVAGSDKTGRFQYNATTGKYDIPVGGGKTPITTTPKNPNPKVPPLTAVISDATTAFSDHVTRGKDGYVDPSQYMAMRNKFIGAYPKNAATFDKNFRNNLSPAERKRLGF